MCKCYHPSSCGYKISIYNDVVMALLTTWLITSVPVREGGGAFEDQPKLIMYLL